MQIFVPERINLETKISQPNPEENIGCIIKSRFILLAFLYKLRKLKNFHEEVLSILPGAPCKYDFIVGAATFLGLLRILIHISLIIPFNILDVTRPFLVI